MFTAVLKKPLYKALPFLAYGSLLLLLAGMVMAQSGKLPVDRHEAYRDMASRPVTGTEVLQFLVQMHGPDVYKQPRYQNIISRMKAVGDQPISIMNQWNPAISEAADNL